MVWGTHDGLCDLQRISADMNPEKYQVMLHDHFISFWPLLDGAERMFPQDNVSCRETKSTQKWFEKENKMFNHIEFQI